ncbi:MAG TPA: LLM class flavin-dependent oxidoreductase [Streptosporangiaceae bacterium]|nr:LLM class flavin-dependent oxidoreductase [Streptosporangiaceae bacterium]
MTDDIREQMRFGIFLGPFHRPEGNPTWDLQRDVRLVEWLDQLGYDEAFIGEHHSGGWEIIGSPEVFIAYAAARTQRIRFGTGVVSLPYHHPLQVAERFVLLDHLTRGRVVLGVGPGALPSDAMMMGLDYSDLRDRMEEALEAILALLDTDGLVDRKTSWFELRGAQLQLKPYTRPRPEIAVTAVVSPAGAKLGGRLGLPMINFGASNPAARQGLAGHWQVLEEEAARVSRDVPPRQAWRLVSPIHIAPTREQAEQEVRFGLEEWAGYFFRDAGIYKAVRESCGLDPDAPRLEVVRRSGLGVIGTPEDAIAHIEGLQQSSGGGFGTYLILAHDWADEDATRRSFELFARYVMPHFQGSTTRRLQNWAAYHAEDAAHMKMLSDAQARARAKYEAEKQDRG